MKLLAAFVAAYSERFFSSENKYLTLLRLPFDFIKYLLSPDRLANRLVDVFDNAETKFSKSLLKQVDSSIFLRFQDLVEHKVGVNQVFHIPPEPLRVDCERTGGMVDIPVPSCHIGVQPIACRLLSASQRTGMVRRCSLNFSFRN